MRERGEACSNLCSECVLVISAWRDGRFIPFGAPNALARIAAQKRAGLAKGIPAA
ncbi:hypothetical protein [uncultured Roseibium sp.]|uniref:hypothetical protein n=1 Tax=uncultured Roseibium sp. TaxID=1936171 RepID=UPI0026078C0E|nr:hypothetical protein [uncultured Roseibium sp.]